MVRGFLYAREVAMSTRDRKARKRAGIPFQKPAKVHSYPPPPAAPYGLGLTSGAEVLAGIVVRGRV